MEQVSNYYEKLEKWHKEKIRGTASKNSCPKLEIEGTSSFCDCEDTNKTEMIPLNGYVVCTHCGLCRQSMQAGVVSDCEWNNYTKSDGSTTNNSRCGWIVSDESGFVNPFVNQMSTYMPKGLKSKMYSKKLDKVISYDLSRIHIQQNYNHKHKAFSRIESLLESYAGTNYPPKVISTAKKLWTEVVQSNKLTRGKVRSGLVVCCLYYSCVHHKCTRSPNEICKQFGMTDTRQFNRGDKEFQHIFQDSKEWKHLVTGTSSSDEYFSRFCSKLEQENVLKEGTAFTIVKKCRKLYEQISEEMVSVVPKSSACGIIFYILKQEKIPITKTKISKSLDICNPTLTKTIKLIKEAINSTTIKL